MPRAAGLGSGIKDHFSDTIILMNSLVLFSHGKESGPWGSKIRYLADLAVQQGCAVLSPDYSGMDDPAARIDQLLGLDLPAHDRLVMVGSSMGGYVATAASATLKPAGLFLLAPAFGMADYPEAYPAPSAGAICVLHGWRDDIVPPERGIYFALQHRAELHVLDGDHRLNALLPEVGALFANFLARVLAQSG